MRVLHGADSQPYVKRAAYAARWPSGGRSAHRPAGGAAALGSGILLGCARVAASIARPLSWVPTTLALYQYASALGALGQHERALDCCNRALDIEPLLLPAHTWRGMILYLGRRHEESVRQYRLALEIDPNAFRALVEVPFPLIALHRWAEALETLQRAESVYGEHPRIVALRGNILSMEGDRSGALAALSRLSAIEESGFVSGFDRALIWVGLGELHESVAELERSFEQQYSWTLFTGTLAIFDAIRGAPRFQALLRKLGLEIALGRSAT